MSSLPTSYQYIFHGTRLNIDPNYGAYFEEIGLRKSDDWQRFCAGDIISYGSTTCLKVQLPNSNKHVYFKRYLFKNHKWRFFLRRSKAATELVNYQHLKELGIPTLDVVALYEQRTFGRLDVACIITKEIPNTLQLDHFYKNIVLKLPTDKQESILKSIYQTLFQQLRTAHAANFFHLDLKWRNILIDLNDDSYIPIWIDCPRGIKSSFRWEKNRIGDLSALSRKALSFFSEQQLYRMLKLYLGKQATKKETRELFFAIYEHLQRRFPKNNNPNLSED